MNPVTNPLNYRQRGMTLIEVLAALAIGAVLLVGLASLVDRSLDDMKGQQAGYYQAQVVDAARRYLDKNAAEVATLTKTAATVLPITLKQLRDGKFLPASFADTNPYQQGTCVLVRQPDPANYAGQFDALIVTTGGEKIGDKDLASVAMLAGSGGGYIPTSAPGVARGASWQMPTDAFRNVKCPGAADAALRGPAHDGGHLASSLFYDGAAQQAADFLYRKHISGKPEANTMFTPLQFGSQGLVIAGQPCRDEKNEAAPRLGVEEATRNVLTCSKEGVWALPSSWKDSVAKFTDLPGAATARSGDVRMVAELGRAFTFAGGEWTALAVDEEGNFTVPGRSSAKELYASQEVRSNGTIHAEDHIWTARDLHVGQDAFVERDINGKGNANIAGNVQITGNTTIDGDVEVKRAVVAAGLEANEWMSAPAIHIWEARKEAGKPCNYMAFSWHAGKEVPVYPQGTIVTDDQRRPMICGPTNTFVYIHAP